MSNDLGAAHREVVCSNVMCACVMDRDNNAVANILIATTNDDEPCHWRAAVELDRLVSRLQRQPLQHSPTPSTSNIVINSLQYTINQHIKRVSRAAALAVSAGTVDENGESLSDDDSTVIELLQQVCFYSV